MSFFANNGKSLGQSILIYITKASLQMQMAIQGGCFWENVSSQTIANQPARDITTALYVIAMNYCTCADTLPGLKNNAGAYFEKLIGHLYARHLRINPSTQMNAVELDGESISLPTVLSLILGLVSPNYIFSEDLHT